MKGIDGKPTCRRLKPNCIKWNISLTLSLFLFVVRPVNEPSQPIFVVQCFAHESTCVKLRIEDVNATKCKPGWINIQTAQSVATSALPLSSSWRRYHNHYFSFFFFANSINGYVIYANMRQHIILEWWRTEDIVFDEKSLARSINKQHTNDTTRVAAYWCIWRGNVCNGLMETPKMDVEKHRVYACVRIEVSSIRIWVPKALIDYREDGEHGPHKQAALSWSNRRELRNRLPMVCLSLRRLLAHTFT